MELYFPKMTRTKFAYLRVSFLDLQTHRWFRSKFIIVWSLHAFICQPILCFSFLNKWMSFLNMCPCLFLTSTFFFSFFLTAIFGRRLECCVIKVTERVSAIRHGAGGWRGWRGWEAGQGERSSLLSKCCQECCLFRFSGRARVNVKVSAYRARERAREAERHRVGLLLCRPRWCWIFHWQYHGKDPSMA